MIPSNETYLKVGSFLIKDPLEGAIDFFVVVFHGFAFC